MIQLFYGIVIGMILSSTAFVIGVLLSRKINQTVSKIERNVNGGQIISLQSKEELVKNKFFKPKPHGHIED